MYRRHRAPALSSVLLTLALILTAFFTACTGSGSVFDNPDNAKTKPLQLKDYEIVMLDAPKIKLSQMTGRNKVVILNFWATWCGPCRQEIPQLKALHREYQDKGVELVGLSVEDPQMATEQVRNMAQQLQINYRVGFSSQEMFAAFDSQGGSGLIPQSFVFGRDGQLLPGGHIIGGGGGVHDKLQVLIEKALKAT